MRQAPLIIRDNQAIVAWVFMAIWMAGLAYWTVVFIRDGGVRQFLTSWEAVLVLVLLISGVACTRGAFGTPRASLVIDDRQVIVTQKWLMRRFEERFPVWRLGEPYLVERRDEDGDVWHRLVVRTPAGREVAVTESSKRERVEAARDRILERLGQLAT